jgi:hypothetical protein
MFCVTVLLWKLMFIGCGGSGCCGAQTTRTHFTMWMSHLAFLQQASITFCVLIWALSGHLVLANTDGNGSTFLTISWNLMLSCWFFSWFNLWYIRHVITHRATGASVYYAQQVITQLIVVQQGSGAQQFVGQPTQMQMQPMSMQQQQQQPMNGINSPPIGVVVQTGYPQHQQQQQQQQQHQNGYAQLQQQQQQYPQQPQQHPPMMYPQLQQQQQFGQGGPNQWSSTNR